MGVALGFGEWSDGAEFPEGVGISPERTKVESQVVMDRFGRGAVGGTRNSSRDAFNA
jgi:hypothetical protein